MLVIRQSQLDSLKNEQFKAKLPVIIPEIIQRLQDIQVLSPSAVKDETLHTNITGDMLRAQQSGISSMNGLLQYCSYRFTVGEHWFENTQISRILENSQMKEREKLIEIEKVLS